MGALLRSVDALLFLCFLFVALTAPWVHYEDWLPLSEDQTPQFLVDLKNYYSGPIGHYLLLERPWFFLGLVWLELLVLWPLSVANVYGMFASKSWFNTTCLISGVTVLSGMAAIVPELIGSGKAINKILMVYYFFCGFGALATLRGLLGNCSCAPKTNMAAAATTTAIKSPAHVKKSK